MLFSLLDRLDDVVEVRPVAGVEFGMEQFAIGANLESAAARGNQRERLDALAELKNFGRQTDGLRRVVSNDAVFDRDFGLHRQNSFPRTKLSMRLMAVKKCARIVALVQEAEPEKACTRRGERLCNSKSVAAARSTRTAASPLQQTPNAFGVSQP